MEGRTKIFRDRVVSLDQTQELGERHLEILTSVVAEALPEFGLKEHGLDHEPDVYVLVLEHAISGAAKRVAFTRMVLADAGRVPAIAENRNAPVRGRMVELIRSRGSRPEILVGVRDLLTEEEAAEAAAVEAEWRRKNEALLAAKRAEEERRERERQRKGQEEEARGRAQREHQEMEKRERAPAPPASVPAGGRPGRGGRRRRRRGSHAGGSTAPGARPAPAPPSGGGTPAPAPQSPGTGGGRRRRRRGRRGSGGGGPQTPAPERPE
jgi:predicted secreted protein